MSRGNKCFQCGSSFVGYHDSDLFCSKRCRMKYYKWMQMVPRCSECSGFKCNYKHIYKGKYSPKECPER